MKHICKTARLVSAPLSLGFVLAGAAKAQQPTSAKPRVDSVVVTASTSYGAGGLHRWLLGDNWRDVWGTPIKVAVLNLQTFAGGLKPIDTGGSAQTTSLRFIGADGRKYAFRPVYKDRLVQLEPYEHTIIADIFRDGLSALHPTAPLGAHPIMRATGIVHPEPMLFVMPDDPALGEFRKEFAGKLGAIEDRALMPKNGAGLGDAVELIDSEDLLRKINRSPSDRIDARTYLKARLIDILINDYDRHEKQWRWARIQERLAGSTMGDETDWIAIPRDRDAAFVHHQGVLMSLGRLVKPNLVSFEARYPNLRKFAGAVFDLDQRLLVGLDKHVWDSTASWLTARITDAVIDSVVWSMPHEYIALHGELHAKLKARRDHLHEAADEYYRILADIVDIHATDADDYATALREGSDVVVRIQRRGARPWLDRRFTKNETREIRLYLHGGDDRATVTGQRNGDAIFLRIIGGNGSNTLIDSSLVNGRRGLTRLYDRGRVDDISYGADSLFNRRPWIEAFGHPVPPLKDRGSRTGPTIRFGAGSGLGIVSKFGFERETFGFRYAPYKERVGVDLEYATGINGWRVAFEGDRRIENERWHYRFGAEMSQLEIVEFRGFGNTVEDSEDPFFDVRQRQWTLRPAIGFALGPEGAISLGPIVKYVTTDSVANTFIADEPPLGFPRFGQAGLQLRAEQDLRDSLSTRGFRFMATASYYPQLWDVTAPFSEVSAYATTYFTFPILTKPVLALRGGVKRVFGDAPYYEAAFVGGRRSLRALHRQRFAGDAALHGTTELRVPLLRFNYLLPWNIGAIGFMEAGRVYVDGASPGTWHSARGYGAWIGLLSPKYSIQILRSNRPERRLIVGTGFAF